MRNLDYLESEGQNPSLVPGTGATDVAIQSNRTVVSVLSPAGLAESSNWKLYSNYQFGSIPKNDIYREGFPKCTHGDGKEFEIITNDGQRHIARVDFSKQYSSEGKQWEIINSGTERIGTIVDSYHVMAWNEVSVA